MAGRSIVILIGSLMAIWNLPMARGGETIISQLIIIKENDPLPWTEMDFNKGQPLHSEPYYSKEEVDCFENRKVYIEGKCWNLRQRGPCDEGQWIVLDSSVQGIRPICQARLCPSDQAYWVPTDECIPLTDTLKCRKRETSLQVDSLGYGACKCLAGEARAMAGNGICYKLYTRGFCDPGLVVGVDPEADKYQATCIPDVCHSNSTNQILLPFKGSCYPEGSHEPCAEGFTITVDVHTGVPKCAQELNTWHVVSPQPRCPLIDHNGDCRNGQAVQVNYIKELHTDKTAHRKKFGVSKG